MSGRGFKMKNLGINNGPCFLPRGEANFPEKENAIHPHKRSSRNDAVSVPGFPKDQLHPNPLMVWLSNTLLIQQTSKSFSPLPQAVSIRTLSLTPKES